MRLDKFLCELNIGTRSQVKQYIKQGLVTVNGTAAVRPEMAVDGHDDRITFKGEVLFYEKFLYFMLHKPAGVVSATQDNTARTVMEVLLEQMTQARDPYLPQVAAGDFFPVGRLDKDTEGLLLITNDGALAHWLLSPRNHITKTYYLKIQKQLFPQDIQRLEQGVDIGEEKPTQPAKVELLADQEVLLTITEGKFHQVKRMLQAVDNQVLYLKRIAMGSLHLDKSLEKGQYRRLTREEEILLKRDYS